MKPCTHEKRRRFSFWLSIIALPLFLWAAVGCGGKSSGAPPPPSPQVTVSRPVREDVTLYLELTGNLQAVKTAQLVARVEGYLEWVYFKEGDFVKQGQMLLRIQQAPYQAAVSQAEANVQAQKASLEHARTELTRYTSLLRQNATSKTNVDQWRYQVDSSQAALSAAQAQLDLARLNLEYTTIKAPFSGRIGQLLVDTGNLVGPNRATPEGGAAGAGAGGENGLLATITQLDPLYVYFNVSETKIAGMLRETTAAESQGKKQTVPVYVGLAEEQGYPHEGRLDFTASRVNTGTGTLLMRGVLPNPDGKMLPGQFARVRVPVGKQENALLVPKVAVGFDQQGSYVLVVDDNNRVKRENVQTGPARGDLFVIEKGIAANDRVIVNGQLRARPGSTVRAEESPAAAGSAGHKETHMADRAAP